MKEIENLNKCKQLIIEWEKAHHINEYMDLYEKLSLYSVFLAENLSQLKDEYNHAYYARKISVSHSFLTNRAEKIAENTALRKAETEHEQLIHEELESEALAYRLDIFLKQVNKVLDMMRTRISLEKKEMERITPNDI